MVVEIALGIVLGFILLALLPAILELAFNLLRWLLGLAIVGAVLGSPWALAEMTGSDAWLYAYPAVGVGFFILCAVATLLAFIRWVRYDLKRNIATVGIFLGGIAILCLGPFVLITWYAYNPLAMIGIILTGGGLIIASRVKAVRDAVREGAEVSKGSI